MNSKENWKIANKTSGKYSLILGIILFVFTLLMRKINFVTMEIMSLIIVTVQIVSMFIVVFIVNKKL